MKKIISSKEQRLRARVNQLTEQFVRLTKEDFASYLKTVSLRTLRYARHRFTGENSLLLADVDNELTSRAFEREFLNQSETKNN